MHHKQKMESQHPKTAFLSLYRGLSRRCRRQTRRRGEAKLFCIQPGVCCFRTDGGLPERSKVVILVQRDKIITERACNTSPGGGHIKMNAEVTAKLKDAWETAGKALVDEPVVFMDSKGNHWLNRHARHFISEREIAVKDLMEWLKIGSLQQQNLSYKDVGFLIMHLPGDNMVAILRERRPDKDDNNCRLTPKESEILRYLFRGSSNKQIASFLKISPRTVNTHLCNIYMKLGCTNRVAACFLALKKGFILPASEKVRKEQKQEIRDID
jgi:DNA-binding CsgD family transcriptional regulator